MLALLGAGLLTIVDPELLAQQPQCSSPNNWAASMAFVQLKNAGLTDASKLNFDKTEVAVLASQNIGNGNFRQIHLITFTDEAGGKITVITKNDATAEECSMSPVDVYLVAKRLN